MITKKQINDVLFQQEQFLNKIEQQHSDLDQISMLSGEGSSLRQQMNYTKGYIAALKWIIHQL